MDLKKINYCFIISLPLQYRYHFVFLLFKWESCHWIIALFLISYCLEEKENDWAQWVMKPKDICKV